MSEQETTTLGHTQRTSVIDVGKPVEWMVDPDQHDKILGVTYEFTLSGIRKTVWYTHNKRRIKAVLILTELAED
jgi:hypothetical protein